MYTVKSKVTWPSGRGRGPGALDQESCAAWSEFLFTCGSPSGNPVLLRAGTLGHWLMSRIHIWVLGGTCWASSTLPGVILLVDHEGRA